MLLAYAFFLLVCIAIVFKGTRGQYMYVHVVGSSMYPCLHHGDKLLALRRFKASRLKLGQIIVCDTKTLSLNLGAVNETGMVVKRITGLPETEICFDTSEGKRSIFVPRDHFFLQGDAVNSLDSKQWGPVPASTIIGVAILRMPRKNDSSFESHSPYNSKMERLDLQACINFDNTNNL